MQRIKNGLLGLLNVAGIGMILSRSYDLIFNPTLFVDESFYLGATRAILSGDPLLQGYIFDKPFLLPWWPIPGIVILGYSPPGLRLVAVVLYLVSFIYFQKALNRLARQPWINALLALVMFQLPLYQSHGISAFAEPFILFTLTMTLYHWSGRAVLGGSTELPERRTLNWFWAGVFTKYPLILWAPVFLVHWPLIGEGRWIAAGIDFLRKLKHAARRHWGWFAAGLVFSLTNSAKFGSLLWFTELAKDYHHPTQVSLAARFLEWSHRLTEALGFTSAAWILIAAFLIVERKYVRHNPVLLGVLVTTFVHFAILFGSGRDFYDRYLILLIPGIFIVLSLLILRLRSRTRFAFPVASLLLAIWAAHSYSRPKLNVGGTPEVGRVMSIVRQELDHPDVILHTHFVWQMNLFARHAIRSGCVSEDCIRFYREGVKEQPLQFALLQQPEGQPPLLLRAPATDAKISPSAAARAPVLPDAAETQKLAQKVLGSLRMGKWAHLTESRMLPALEASAVAQLSGELAGFARFKPLHEGPRLMIRAEGKGHGIEIDATIAQTYMHEYPYGMNQRRYRPVAVVHRFAVDGRDVTDLAMPIFFGGYVQAL